jgi:hypothetical protein
LEIYNIAFSTYNENQNCYTEDITEHTGLLCCKLPTQGMMYPETYFGQTILPLPVKKVKVKLSL